MSEKKGEGTPENQGKNQEIQGQNPNPKWIIDYPFIKNKESGDLLERVPWGFVE